MKLLEGLSNQRPEGTKCPQMVTISTRWIEMGYFDIGGQDQVRGDGPVKLATAVCYQKYDYQLIYSRTVTRFGDRTLFASRPVVPYYGHIFKWPPVYNRICSGLISKHQNRSLMEVSRYILTSIGKFTSFLCN